MSGIKLEKVLGVQTNQKIGQCRAIPVKLSESGPEAVLAVYGADFDIDPFAEMFFFPTDTLHMVLFDCGGNVLWKRDLGKGVVPGIWFCPVYAADMDGDSVDEIYYVDNENIEHPLSIDGYCMTRINALTGETSGRFDWPRHCRDSRTMSHAFRNFIIGGQARGENVLVCAQGTYHDMHFQAYGKNMEPRFTLDIPELAPGARGSHMCPVVDHDGSGVDRLMWGERCISLDTGVVEFCADRDSWRGHSDIIQPFYDYDACKWYFYVCRETDDHNAPRVGVYDFAGKRIWGAIDYGHMDLGWVAHFPRGIAACTARIGKKFCGPDGRYHSGVDEFCFDALSGERIELPTGVYRMIPVDLDGDGYHELVRGAPSGNGDVFDSFGNLICSVGGSVALACKFLDLPGEQLLSISEDGEICAWADAGAKDSPRALARYQNAYYRANKKIMANGYNWWSLSGI